MLRLARRLALVLLPLVSLAACGGPDQATPTPQIQNVSPGVTVKFVGDASCPTQGAAPYSGDNATPGASGATTTTPPYVNSLPIVGQPIDEMPHTHVAPPVKVQYLHDPPTSGCHYSLGNNEAPIAAGVYDQQIDPEFWVHNLEHGYIAVLYNCPGGCIDDFNTLRSWYQGLPPDPAANGQINYPKVIVLPWKSMKDKFAVVSWDYYDGMSSSLSLDEVKKFYENHVGHSPEGAMTA